MKSDARRGRFALGLDRGRRSRGACGAVWVCNASAPDLRSLPNRGPSESEPAVPLAPGHSVREPLHGVPIRPAPTVRQSTFAGVPVLQYLIGRDTRTARKGYAVLVIIPLYDEDPLERKMTPFVTYGLIAINFAVFLFELTLTPTADANFIRTFGLVPAALRDLWPAGLFPPVLSFLT